MGSTENNEPLSTPDDYLNISDAANFLGVNRETIRRYLRLGIIQERIFKRRGGTRWVSKYDLVALKKLNEEYLASKATLWDLLKSIKIKLHVIDQKLNFLMDVNSLNVSILRDADDKMLLQLYDEVCDFSEVPVEKINLNQMKTWANILSQVTELELVRLVGPCMDTEPWKPFYNLCVRLTAGLFNTQGFSEDLEAQEIYRLLEKARRNIAQAVVIFNENFSVQMNTTSRAKLYPLEARMNTLDRYIASELKIDV
ncbi:MAG: helix-turn-helix domain-containing protein [Candidatus Thorarchaeota archaeon]